MKKITFLLLVILIYGFAPPKLASEKGTPTLSVPNKITKGIKIAGSCGDWGFHSEKSLITHSFAKAVWTYTGDAGNTVKYLVYLKETETGGPNPQFVLKAELESTSSFPEYTFSDLIADTEYQVKIERRCNTQKSDIKTVFRTKKDPTVDVPSDEVCIPDWQNNGISQTGGSESSINFTWPSAGQSAFYKVEYRKSGLNNPWIPLIDNTTTTGAMISGLPTSNFKTDYEVQVTRTCLNNSTISIVGVVQTKEAGILDCSGIWDLSSTYTPTHNAMTLNWNKIGGATYEVWYREHDFFDPNCYTRSTADVTGTSHKVTGLKKSTEYDFVVIKKCPNYDINAEFCPSPGISEPFNTTDANVSKRTFKTRSSVTTNFLCYSVTGVDHTNVTINSATLFYTDRRELGNNLEEITYVWSRPGEERRQRHDGSPLDIGGLCPNTTYTYWIEKMCMNQTQPALEGKKTFTTANYPTCPVPTGLGFNAEASHFINAVAWSGFCGIPSYTLEVKKTGSNNWVSYTTDKPEFIREAEWGTNYTVRVKSNCDGGGSSDWSNELTFTTSEACPSPSNVRVVSVLPHGFELEWDETLSMATSFVVQAKEGDGDWSGDMYSSTDRRLYFAYLIEKHNTMFQFRVRSNCENTNWVYTDPIRSWVDPNATCDIPTDFREIYIHATDGKIAWNAVPLATSYTLSVFENDTWTEIDVGNATEYVSETLTPEKAYEVVVRSECGDGVHSDWSAAIKFTTPPLVDPNASCDIPTDFRKIYIHATSGKIAWNAVSGATNYKLGVLESGTWTGIDVGNVTEYVSDLIPGKAYEVAILSECENGEHSDWSGVIRFTTPLSSSLKARLNKNREVSIIYPNTNHGEFTIKFRDNGKQLRAVTIFNMAGMKVFHKDYNREVDEDSYNLTNKLSSGMYKVQISSEDGIEFKSIIVE